MQTQFDAELDQKILDSIKFTCALGNPGHNGNLKESSMTIFQEGNCKTFFQQKKI